MGNAAGPQARNGRCRTRNGPVCPPPGEYDTRRAHRAVNYPITLQINGQTFNLEVAPDRLLVDILRHDLGLTGTKEACSVGVCGACTVLLDGKTVSSCLLPGVMASGRAITTVEGLANNEELLPIQQAFIDHGGFQCGACTPGQVVAAKALLDEIPHPTEDQIKDWMMGNICRCTGYYKIIESIQAAAAANP